MMDHRNFAALVLLLAGAASVSAETHVLATFPSAVTGTCLDCEPDPCGYGPPPDCRRKTLLQWSYGTSFTGGPNLEEPLVTDRPDFTEASSTVGAGVVQIETGYTYVFDNDNSQQVRAHSYPETLLRVGMLADWFELRIGYTYIEETTRPAAGPATLSRGSEDLLLGIKLGLTPQEGLLPEMVVIPQMFVPTGSGGRSADETLPGFVWVYGWEVSDCISTAGQSIFQRLPDDVTGEPYLLFSQSWTIGLSITDRLGSYIEWFSLIPSGADTNRTQHFLDGGFTVLINDNFQWDIRGGLGLNRAADDYFVGTGFSVRFY